MGTGDHLQEQKGRALKLDTPSSTEVKNVWSDTSSPTCALISRYVIMFRDNFTFVCDLLSSVLQVGWLKAEDQTILTLHNKVVTHNSRISVTHDNHRTWQLHIRQVKESDRGCYMCQINTSIMKKQVGCVDVHGKWLVWWRGWIHSSVLVG